MQLLMMSVTLYVTKMIMMMMMMMSMMTMMTSLMMNRSWRQ